jgi:hypothetical protein
MGLSGFEPGELASAFAVPIGRDQASEHVGNEAAAPAPEYGDRPSAADREVSNRRLREATRAERRRRIAARLFTIIRPEDPQRVPTDEQLASEVKEFQEAGESWPDFVALVREAAREAGLYDLTGPTSRGGAGVAGSEGNVEMALAVATTAAGGTLTDAEAEAAATVLTNGRYAAGKELDEWIERMQAALRTCPQESEAYRPLRSALESLLQSKRFGRTLNQDERRIFADALRHGEQAREQYERNNAHRLPEGNAAGNRTGNATRTERQRPLR